MSAERGEFGGVAGTTVLAGRATLWSALLLSFAGATGCDININGLDRDVDVFATEAVQHTILSPLQSDLRVEAVNGEIIVIGDPDRTTVEIYAVKSVGSDTRRDANDWLDRIEVRVIELADEIRVETIQPRDNHGRVVEVDYEIRIPSHLNVRAFNVNGFISVAALDADLTADQVNGDFEFLGVYGNVRGHLVNGRIDAEVWLPEAGIVDFDVTNGDIALDVPEDVSAELRAHVTNGSVSVSQLDLIDPVTTARSVVATLGDGSGSIDVETVNGTIRIRGF